MNLIEQVFTLFQEAARFHPIEKNPLEILLGADGWGGLGYFQIDDDKHFFFNYLTTWDELEDAPDAIKKLTAELR